MIKGFAIVGVWVSEGQRRNGFSEVLLGFAKPGPAHEPHAQRRVVSNISGVAAQCFFVVIRSVVGSVPVLLKVQAVQVEQFGAFNVGGFAGRDSRVRYNRFFHCLLGLPGNEFLLVFLPGNDPEVG